ncbi:hypothetical protein NP233_g3310 [Leucocoprinus birnbaumii]|uniref:non-specific serine/threonine protein kinase n=1 Tax=Leucocoprinus birnbaumii TaxID=56174 RepID=A0AAD5YSY9_9AGAR|nr:hypothetical protein NP233_g3310 [Leucocoprinus birnbaumii]
MDSSSKPKSTLPGFVQALDNPQGMSFPNPLLSNRDVRRTEPHYFACGGVADLYRGQWTRQAGNPPVEVAIKVIRRCTWNDKTAAERAHKRFLREAHLWAQLQHPSIVPFHGLIFEKDFPGLVMPYYKNGDLIQYLRKHLEANKHHLVCQVSAGLEYLHNIRPHAVVHGDIKASNIMVTDCGEARLTDFGVAKMLSVSGYTTTSMGGTCRWMSPEILEEHDPSPTFSSDIWAFGMTILQVFTGKVPFESMRNDATVIVSLARGVLPEQPVEINDAMWALLKRCWKTRPTDRPSSSTVSIALNIMFSEPLAAEDVDHLIDLLTRENSSHSDKETQTHAPSLSPSPTSVTLVEPTARTPETEKDKQRRQSFSNILRRRLSLDRFLPHDTSTPLLPSFLRRPSDESSVEPPPQMIASDPSYYRCRWPDCGARFTCLDPWRAHHAQHWCSLPRDDNSSSGPRGAASMPSITSVLS